MSTGLSSVERESLSGAGSVAPMSGASSMPAIISETLAAYSLDELAEMWGTSRSSVQRTIARGELIAIKVGGLTRVTHGEARRYLAEAQKAEFRKPGRRGVTRARSVA